MDKPLWLRRLAAATLLQALRDLRKEEHRELALDWMAAGGYLGNSDWCVCDVLGISPDKLVRVARKLSGSVGVAERESEDWLRHFRGLLE
jgi:hypothetical protein